MKKYYNAETGERYFEGQSINRKIDNGFFSGYPTVEQLLSWGFVEEVEPVPVPPTPEELLSQEKEKTIKKIHKIDESSAVNGFYLFGEDMWITPAERANYMITLEGAKRLGIEEIPFLGHNISVDTAISMLDAINVYAMQCFDITKQHIKEVEEMDNIDDVKEFNCYSGYPQKLIFN